MLMILASSWTSSAQACLWDNDTLQMERFRFPQAWELISGRFARHSPAFYAWRIRDRLPKIDGTEATAPLLDDVAVAYEKTGRHDMAIWAMWLEEGVAPGRYETYANLATFLIHRGDLQAGLTFIDRALRINPNAHFGREEYQKLLVQYVLERRNDGHEGLPLRGATDAGPLGPQPGVPPEPGGFAGFLKAKGRDGGPKAVKGILGMMRFGNHDSPVLLEALGDLLMAPHKKEDWRRGAVANAFANQGKDAKRLAVRAYLKASYEVKDEGARRGYRALAQASIQSQSDGAIGTGQLALADVEQRLRQEIEKADRYVSDIARDEKRWIDAGLDVEKQFAWKYMARR